MAKLPTAVQNLGGKATDALANFNKVHAPKGYWHGTANATGFLGKGGAFLGDAAMLGPRAAGRVGNGVVSGVFHGSLSMAKGAAKGAGWLLMQPVRGVTKMGKAGFNLARGHPIAAGVTALGVGAFAWSQHARHTAIDQTQADFNAAATGGPSGNYNYMNSVSPAEAAALEAQMKQGGQGGSFADAAQQRAAAATAGANAPTV